MREWPGPKPGHFRIRPLFAGTDEFNAAIFFRPDAGIAAGADRRFEHVAKKRGAFGSRVLAAEAERLRRFIGAARRNGSLERIRA